MLRSDDQLLSNRIEVLKVKQADLLRMAESLEQQLRVEGNRYDRELALRRQRAPFERDRGADQKQEMVRRLGREALKQGYIVGVVSSLLLGLLVVFGNR